MHIKIDEKEYNFKDEGTVKNTFSLFPSHAPNLGYWQCTVIGKHDWVNHFDIGSLPIEKIIGMLRKYKPHLVMGDPNILMNVLGLFSKEELSELEFVITGNDAPFEDIKKFVEENGAGFGSVYGRTENGLIMYTELDKWEEGYLLGDHEVEVDIETDELIIDGEHTGDKGFINKHGKIDLDISRLPTNTDPSICGGANAE